MCCIIVICIVFSLLQAPYLGVLRMQVGGKLCIIIEILFFYAEFYLYWLHVDIQLKIFSIYS